MTSLVYFMCLVLTSWVEANILPPSDNLMSLSLRFCVGSCPPRHTVLHTTQGDSASIDMMVRRMPLQAGVPVAAVFVSKAELMDDLPPIRSTHMRQLKLLP